MRSIRAVRDRKAGGPAALVGKALVNFCQSTSAAADGSHFLADMAELGEIFFRGDIPWSAIVRGATGAGAPAEPVTRGVVAGRFRRSLAHASVLYVISRSAPTSAMVFTAAELQLIQRALVEEGKVIDAALAAAMDDDDDEGMVRINEREGRFWHLAAQAFGLMP